MTDRKRLVLGASLALNLFLIGLVGAGGIVWSQAAEAKRQARSGQSFWAATETLPPAHRDAVRGAIRAKVAKLRPTFRALRQERLSAAAMIGAPSLDKAATLAAIQRVRQAEFDARLQLDRAAIEALAGLPQPERARLAWSLARGGPRSGMPPRGAGALKPRS